MVVALRGVVFFDDEMPRGARRHLRQVRDAKHLVLRAERRQFAPDRRADFAADIRIHLVKHQQRRGVGLGQHGLEREHHARGLAAGGDFVQRQRRLAGVGRKEDFDLAVAVLAQFRRGGDGDAAGRLA